MKKSLPFSCSFMMQSFILGSLLALALPPFNFFILPPLVIPLFLHIFLGLEKPRQAWWSGYTFGFGYFFVGLYWVSNALLLDPTFYWLVPLSSLILPGYLALYIAVPTLLTWYLRKKSTLAVIFFWAFSLTVFEIARGFILTGCPWNPFSLLASHSDILLQSAAFVGSPGLSFLMVLFSSSFLLFIHERTSWFGLAFLIVSFLSIILVGAHRLDTNPTRLSKTPLVLVQPNIDQKPFFTSLDRARNIKKIINLTTTIHIDEPHFIIWPESSVPYTVNKGSLFESFLQNHLHHDTVLIFGTMRTEPRKLLNQHPFVYNSLLALTKKDGIVSVYDKHHLLPYGEYIPLRKLMNKFIPVQSITGGLSDFKPGAGPMSLHPHPNLPALGPTICYESIFTNAQIDRTNRPQFMVNVTNDAWYGNSPGPYQHLQMARLRAIEEGLPLVRVATTGISAVIDPLGRIIASIPFGIQQTLQTFLPDPLPKLTLYARLTEWLTG